jgi:plastocyanin
MKRLVATLALAAFAAISAACSSTPASAPPVPSGPVADGPTIVAKDLRFQSSSIEVKAGSNVTIHFDNEDSAPHNVAIYKDNSASSPISVGQIVTSAKADQVVPALAPGTYFFRCDVHHDMTGTIVAK